MCGVVSDGGQGDFMLLLIDFVVFMDYMIAHKFMYSFTICVLPLLFCPAA